MNEEVLKVLNELLAEIKETKNEVKKMNSNFKLINKQLKTMHKEVNKAKESIEVVEDNVVDLNIFTHFVIDTLADAMDGMIEYDESDEDLDENFLPLFDEDFKL